MDWDDIDLLENVYPETILDENLHPEVLYPEIKEVEVVAKSITAISLVSWKKLFTCHSAILDFLKGNYKCPSVHTQKHTISNMHVHSRDFVY